jgi:NADPH:quinone reductase-like Zn-dependent oxidoreductase
MRTGTSQAEPNGEAFMPPGMRAIVQNRYGGADLLQYQRVAVPAAAENEVLVRVHAAGLDRGTWHLMSGKPYLMRVVGLGFRGPKQPVPGRDLAGTVQAVGSAVTKFTVGEEVYGVGRGSFAEYAVAAEDKLAHKPRSLSFEQAAVVPISAGTALQALVDHGRIEAGQRVLIIGASGGVGSYAVQLAKAFGAEVTGVAGASKQDLLRSLGADRALDYTTDDFADGSHRYDLVVDIAGNPSLARLRSALKLQGTAVLVGGEEGGDLTGGMKPVAARSGAVAAGESAPGLVYRQGAGERSRAAHRPADVRPGGAEHRHDVSAGPRPGRDAPPRGGERSGARWPSPSEHAGRRRHTAGPGLCAKGQHYSASDSQRPTSSCRRVSSTDASA